MADAPEDAPAAETRDCKYCSRSLGCDSYVLKQWQKPGPPCCIACAAERSAAGGGGGGGGGGLVKLSKEAPAAPEAPAMTWPPATEEAMPPEAEVLGPPAWQLESAASDEVPEETLEFRDDGSDSD